jgi:hypothetical protein
MSDDHAMYGAAVSELLSLQPAPARLLPLQFEGTTSGEAVARLSGFKSPRELFPSARAPEAALAGLWLYFGCFDEAHSVAQDLPTAEGSYWHGILHRMEPDPGNASYWFRRVGTHAVFGPLMREARELAAGSTAIFPAGQQWDPFAFIAFCERARRAPGSDAEQLARDIATAEWRLLFEHCARALPGE